MKNTVKHFGRPRLLIIGCGDIGMRLLPLLRTRFRVFALTSQPQRCAELRAAGAIPVLGNLDQPASLKRLRGLATRVIYLAPPPASGEIDPRSKNLAAILPDKCQLVYVSTTGVYGDCGGASFDETRPLQPQTARARRRVAAEQSWRAWAVRSGSRLAILRVPGIYAAERLPFERLQNAVPALQSSDDVYSNHIHADDLAALIRLGLFKGQAQRVYHAVDDSEIMMGDYFDLVADSFRLPRPPRLERAELASQVSATQLSFMSESRRLQNRRIKGELGARLQYPTVQQGVAAIRQQHLEAIRHLPCGFRFSWQT